MPHLRSIELSEIPERSADAFPFSVPIIRHLERLDVDQPITFLVGENGSGKSTLLEGIAAAANLPTVGSQSIDKDETLAAQRSLARSLSLVWNRRAKRGFFLRAEVLGRLKELDQEYAGRSAWAKGLASGPSAASLADMERRYGVNLDENSH